MAKRCLHSIYVAVHGYHIFVRGCAVASVGAVLQCEQEAGNSKDPYSVVVKEDVLTVGRVPHTICSSEATQWCAQ